MKYLWEKLASFLWHPFLFVLFALLSLFVANQKRLLVIQIVRPLLILFILTGLFLILVRWLVKDWQRAGLITSLFLLLFFSYGHVYGLLEGNQFLGIQYGRHRVLLVVFTALLVMGAMLILRSKHSMLKWTNWLNLCTLLLIILQAGQLSVAAWQAQRLTSQVRQDEHVVSGGPLDIDVDIGRNRPDIYFIILDTYTRQDAYQAVLGYDNTGFIDELRARGFTIADCSLSNYNATSASVLASLDMLYLDELEPALGQGYKNLIYLDPYLENNRVTTTLKELGYNIVVFESGYSPTELIKSDVYLTSAPGLAALFTGGLTRYESLLMQSSAGILVYDFSDRLPVSIRYFLDAPYVAHRQRILFELDQLGKLEDIQSPKFAFAHILAPHTPFVFTSDGLPVERTTPFTLNDDPELGDRKLYNQHFIDQTIYINQRVLELVDEILAQPGNPVIILQGDHGMPRSGAWASAILNAVRLPGGEEVIYPGISPVNTFRIIFNQLFDAGLPLSPDRSCHFDQGDPASCKAFVEPSQQCTRP
jgi:hypothetical protein